MFERKISPKTYSIVLCPVSLRHELLQITPISYSTVTLEELTSLSYWRNSQIFKDPKQSLLYAQDHVNDLYPQPLYRPAYHAVPFKKEEFVGACQTPQARGSQFVGSLRLYWQLLYTPSKLLFSYTTCRRATSSKQTTCFTSIPLTNTTSVFVCFVFLTCNFFSSHPQ